MSKTSWARVAIAWAGFAVAGGVFALASGARDKPILTSATPAAPVPAPTPREKIADEAWLPKPGSDPGIKGVRKIHDLAADPPSAFPDLVPPVPDRDVKDAEEANKKYKEAFEKMCPRLFGKTTLKIEATDSTLRKLLKARLHQGTLEFQQLLRVLWGPIAGPSPSVARYHECLLDMQSAAAELWAKQPKELVPWLEELLIMSKDSERVARIRVLHGSIPPIDLSAARRHRLKIEAELWKAKNAE